MNKNKLIGRAFLDALGVLLYVVGLAWFLNNMQFWFNSTPDTWLAPAIAMMLFIISACATGSLVLLKPVLLYMEGDKKGAVSLFIYTLGFLVILALLVGLLIIGLS
jgi:hypothetical protein